MVIEIPKQLQKEEFRFILLRENSKIAFEKQFEKINNYRYNDPKLLHHLKNNGNYGVLAGHGDLVIVDIDNKDLADELINKIDTFAVKTCGGTYHFYFLIPDFYKNVNVNEGEIKCKNVYVVGPNCYAIDKKKNHEGAYTVVKNINIKPNTKSAVYSYFPNISSLDEENSSCNIEFIKQEKANMAFLEENVLKCLKEEIIIFIKQAPQKEELQSKYKLASRDERDQKVIVHLILKGFEKYIFSIFDNYPIGDKYKSHPAPKKYLEYAIKSAKSYTGVNNPDDISLENEIRNSTKIVLRKKVDTYLSKIAKLKSPTERDRLIVEIANKTGIPKKSIFERYQIIARPIPKKVFMNFSDLLNLETQDVQYEIEPIFAKGSLIYLFGDGGSAKSLLTLKLCIDRILHTRMCSKFNYPDKKIKILYYDLERSVNLFAKRAQYIINGLIKKGINITPEMICNFKENLVFTSSFDKWDLEEELKIAMQYDILVYDSYRRILPGDENKSLDVNIFYEIFLKKLIDAGKTLIIIHHRKKGAKDFNSMSSHENIDTARGSNDIIQQADTAYSIQKSEETEENNTLKYDVVMTRVKNNLGLLGQKQYGFKVEMINNEKSTFFTYGKEIKILSPIETRHQEIINIISKGTNQSLKIREHLMHKFNISSRTAISDLAEITKSGVILKNKHGVYELPNQTSNS